MTQGVSDGTVPLGDLRSTSQISHGSMAFGMEDFGEMSNGTTRDTRVMPSDVRFAAYSSVAAPLYVSDVGNILPQQGVYMSTDVNAHHQHAFSLSHQKLSSGNNCSSGGLIEKDIDFMERAAAASATVLPGRSVSVSMCDSVGGKGIGYVGGGFTEMIRGITRLSTAADVQSLMQARVSPSAATGPGSSLRSSPTCCREMQARRPDNFPLPSSMTHGLIGKTSCLMEADQVCESDAELTTLSLLPNVPSKMCPPGKVAIRDESPSVQPHTHGVTDVAELPWHHSSRLEPLAKVATRDGSPSAQPPMHGVSDGAEHPRHHQISSRLEPQAKVPIRDGSPSAQPPIHGATHVTELPWHQQITHVAESPWHQQAFSKFDPSMKAVIRDSAQPPLPGIAHVAEAPWLQQVSSRLESSVPLASRNPCMPQVGVQLASGIPLFSLPTKKPTNGMNPPGMGMSASPVMGMADGAVVDEVSLEQVYGGSTDPVLLVDDNNQVLWFNKPYDKALKSASERLSGKTKPTGPYIDPLGHPTPLCSFVLSIYGKPSRATLWGFLKKLVIQESELPLQQGSSGPSSQLPLQQGSSCPSSQLQLCMGEASLRMSPAHMEPNGRMGSVVCASNSRLTTVTLESITEFHMDAPAAAECVEAAEARLGAGSEPAFITDCLNRVRWVNAALKRMLGHINFGSSNACSGASGSSGADVALSSSLEASTFAVCCTEKIPSSAWAFSCRVNLEWKKGSKRRSMMVPCDVSRLACTSRSPEVNWVWQFDMAVSLCLNVPS